MKRTLLIAPLLAFLATAVAPRCQEVLAPLQSTARPCLPKSVDTVYLSLPFFDDFSDYEGLPDAARWLPSQSFVNKDYAPLPPSVGMATLDALDAYGRLYPHASTNPFTADTMTSQPVRLDSLLSATPRRLSPADSVALSFFYLPGGWYGNTWELVGDAPATGDSLFLDFFNADSARWDVVWASPGGNVDTAGIRSKWPWRFACVKIENPAYFSRRFQFRFRNYASLDPNPKSGISGNCDQWNIDYVLLDYNRSNADSLFRDVAFVSKAPSLLRHCQAMPARQFSAADMESNIDITIVNRYNQTLASTYRYSVVDNNGQQVHTYDGGYENIPAFFPDGKYQTMPVHAHPPVGFVFPVNAAHSAAFRVTHIVQEGVGGDNHKGNDTIVFNQLFDNFYAYDDGVPENGYGLTAQGSRMYLACRYDLRVTDTLTAVDLFFNSTRNNENADIRFRLCAWSCENGRPATLIYKDDAQMSPQFDGFNKYHRYKLSSPLILNDTVFIGLEQLSNDYINLGFDRSTDSRQFTYYRTGNEWMQSILRGSVMMRPLFGMAATLATSQPQQVAPSLSLFPNPASSSVHLAVNTTNNTLRLTLFDIQGRKLWDIPFADTLTLSEPDGVYLLRVTDTETGLSSLNKLVIRR